MTKPPRIEAKLLAENAELRACLDAAEDALRAIRSGEVDALVVEGAEGPRVYTLEGVDAASNRFRGEILAQIGDVVIAVDVDQRVIYLNAAAERQYGLPASAVLGCKLSTVYEARWVRPQDEAAASTALRIHGEWRGELVHVARDGREIYVESSMTVLREISGQQAGVLAIVRDITDRKEVEAKLRQNEVLFSTLVEQAPTGVYVVNAELRLQQVNALALPVFKSVRPLIGRDLFEVMAILWGSALGANIVNIFRHTLETGERYISPPFTEYRQDVHVEQSYEWETQRITLFDGQRGVVCYFRDITERKAADEAKAQLAAIVESSDDAIISKGLDGRIRSWNAGAERIFGYQADEIIGEPITLLLPPEKISEEEEILARLRQGQRCENIDTIRVTKDGQRIDVSITISLLLDRDGNIVGASKIVRDITRQKFIEAHNKLLTAEVNHRAKNLLGVVQAIANVTAKQGDPETFATRLSQRIGALAASHDLLVESQWEGADVQGLIEAQLGHFKDLIGTRLLLNGQRVQLKPPAAQAIGMALHELGTNAAKYGAFSNSEGQVRIVWQIDTADKPTFSMSWKEEGGPKVVVPKRTSFGQRVIGRMAEAAVQGEVEISFCHSGFAWTLTAPVESTVAGALDRGSDHDSG